MACRIVTQATFLKQLCQKVNYRYTSSYKWYQYLREPQPCDISTVYGGIPVITPAAPKLTEVIESRDPEEWKFVEYLLPRETVPAPPKHDSYPTPSGWFPPKEPTIDEEYRVRRTRYHNFPLYHIKLHGGNSNYTVIRKIEGDIRKMNDDIKKYLEEKTGKKAFTNVNEVCSKITIRGIHLEIVNTFLKEKGF